MAFLKVSDKKRGRPLGSGRLKKPEHKSSVPARITPELRDFLDTERHSNETISETIFRLIRQARKEKIAWIKKADALEERLERVTSLSVRGGA